MAYRATAMATAGLYLVVPPGRRAAKVEAMRAWLMDEAFPDEVAAGSR